MTSPTPQGSAFLDFFVLEAGEYVEQIDGLLARASGSGPDADTLQKVSRALRGTATMARLTSFAELASTIEAVGRALRQGVLRWDETIKGALVAAVDDLKLLVRAARAWSSSEDEWALRRIAELSQFVQPQTAPGPSAQVASSFFVNECNNVAAGLELLATRAPDRAAAINILTRVRALRGVAGVKEVPALAEVSEAAESAIRPLEVGQAQLSQEQLGLLRAAADVLRAIAGALGRGERVTTDSPEYRAYMTALDSMLAHERSADRVVPIAKLFYDDAGPHIVEKAADPPMTPGQRFRMEVVSLGEHLHGVIDEARVAADDIQREHARSELGRALRAIRATAASFEQLAVAQTVEGYLEKTGDLTAEALDAISRFAGTISPASITHPATDPNSVPIRMSQVRSAVGALGQAPGRSAAPPPSQSAVTAPRPVAPPATAAQPAQPAQHARVFAAVGSPANAPAGSARPATPAAAHPHPQPQPLGGGASALDAAIASFDSLAGERFAEPVPVADEAVPVDALLYRGRAALERAIALRDSLRATGGPPASDVLEEIYDLLDLARVPEPSF